MKIAEQGTNSDNNQVQKDDFIDPGERFYENMIGKEFLAESFTSIEDEELSSSYLRGKVIFLNFWYKNCSPCIAEMEGLKELQMQYENEKVVFIMITWENTEVIKEIQKEYDLSYKMVSIDKDSISKLGIRGYPSSFVIDKAGKVVYARAGGQDVVQKATVAVLSHYGPVIAEQLELVN